MQFATYSRHLFRWLGRFIACFILFCAGMGLAEWLGLPKELIGFSFLLASIVLYTVIGIATRTSKLDEYYVAGRRIPAFFNGLAIGADWMSAASFISMAGTLYVLGYEGLAYIMGWTGGYVLLALLLAPYLRKFGGYTIPEFLGVRFKSKLAHLIGALCAIIVSFTYITAQVTGVGLVMARLLNIDYNTGVLVGVAAVMFCSFLGGMKAITWTQVVQCVILVVAYLVPVTFLAVKLTTLPVPQLVYGSGFEKISDLENKFGITKGFATPYNDWSGFQFVALIICLMLGTAGLPHILVRAYTVPTVSQARKSIAWAFPVILILYLTAPAYTILTRWEVGQNVIGRPFKEASALSWVQNWQRTGMLKLGDQNGNGIVEPAEFEFTNSDIIVLASPEIAGLPFVVVALVAVGGLAAALSTADGLLIVISSALSQDIYFHLLNPRASPKTRVWLGKGMILVTSACAALLAFQRIAIISETVAWAFSIAASTFFPVLVLGIFWKRYTKAGAIAGMLGGLLTTVAYIIISRFGPSMAGVAAPPAGKAQDVLGNIIQIVRDGSADDPFGRLQIFGVFHTGAGIFGITICFMLSILVSLLSARPDAATGKFLDDLQIPLVKSPAPELVLAQKGDNV